MRFGPVSLSSLVTSDEVAPGAPTFVSVAQVSNSRVVVTLALPTADADGSELSGLTRLVIATAPQVGGVNPFEGLGMSEILELQGVVATATDIDPTQAGKQVSLELPVVNLGGAQAFAAACSDSVKEPAPTE